MADTITIRTDEETEHALDVLTREGTSRSAAIRQALLEAASRRERAGRDAPGSAADGPWPARRRQRGGGTGPRPRRRALMIYLDSAAVVKLAHAEAESPALRALARRAGRDGLDQLGADRDRVLPRAGQIRARCGLPAACRAGPDRADRPGPAHPDPGPDHPPGHRPQPGRDPPRDRPARPPGTLTSFVTYDKRLLDAAAAAGLPVDSPA